MDVCQVPPPCSIFLKAYVCEDICMAFLSHCLFQVLLEVRQVLPDGRVRERGLVVSEKLKAGEEWQDGVLRAVQEELGSALGGQVRDA